jgi:hypothetical protein
MAEKPTYEELLKWRILLGHAVADIESHGPYPKSISIADMAEMLQESLDMASEKNHGSLSNHEKSRTHFYQGYH